MNEGSDELDTIRSFVTSGFSNRAVAYHQFMGSITSRVADPLLDLAFVGEGIRLLDLATGPGYVAGLAAERGALVTGIDISPPMIELARQSYPDLTFQVGDAEQLPFEAETFDAVVGNFILHLLAEPETVLRECRRILAPGGLLAFSLWDDPMANRLVGIVTDAAAEAGVGMLKPAQTGPHPFRFSDEQELRTLLAFQDFHDITVETVAFTHVIPDVTTFWDGIVNGTVSIAKLVGGHDHATTARIQEAFKDLASSYLVDDHLEIPVSVKIVVGRAK